MRQSSHFLFISNFQRLSVVLPIAFFFVHFLMWYQNQAVFFMMGREWRNVTTYQKKRRIFFQNKDITSIPLKKWRSKIAYLSQDIDLSFGSLLENLTYGISDYSMDEVNKLVEQFDLKSFVDNLEYGYNTIVGEKGITLSGGQRQRIALIRAILKDADIYLLDEPTSALDTRTEKLVQITLEKYLKGKTVLVIAHRLKTITAADEIVILNNKTIEYHGNHSELKKSCNLYNQLLEDSVH